MARIGASKSNIWCQHNTAKEFTPGTVGNLLRASVEIPNNKPRDFRSHDALQGLLSPLLVGALANFKVVVKVQNNKLKSPTSHSHHGGPETNDPSGLVVPSGNNVRLKEQALTP